MILYHVTTPKKARKYHGTGYIKKPVRGFDTLMGAMVWAIKVGRKVIYRINCENVYLLPDHHNKHGKAWWANENVPINNIKCVSRNFIG